MTLSVHQSNTWEKTSPRNVRNPNTAQALKRYLDLTLTGTKKNLATHGKNIGRKGHPPSPYTFDRPDMEHSVYQVLNAHTNKTSRFNKAPSWVQEINEKVKNHNGEAPMFTEQFLPAYKLEQHRPESRPLSGISTKSAPVVINGEMYYRPNRKHTYLQASNRPCSAKDGRQTRANKLKNKHRAQSMTALPSNDTKQQLKRMKEKKPIPLHLSRDLLPIPCHTGETPHSFIIGARYNCSNFMDSRSFARLGLYVPRQDPLRTFLKTYKGEDGIEEPTSESDFVGFTSVRVGGSSTKTQPNIARKPPTGQRMQRSLPPPHVRRVVREAWLNGDLTNNTETNQSRNSVVHYAPQIDNENLPNSKVEYKAPSTTPRSSKQVSKSKPGSRNINITGQQVNNAVSESPVSQPRSTPGGSRASKVGTSPVIRKRSIEAIVPCPE
nr:uncharacterized protein LOC100182232 [Ciona intestinalis]|eukprot:XP_002120025.1 uncharacterized protein LOC100182232 [Ciona intestinalis]